MSKHGEQQGSEEAMAKIRKTRQHFAKGIVVTTKVYDNLSTRNNR